MRLRSPLIAVSLAINLSLVILLAASAPQVKAQREEQNARTVVFVLSANGLPNAAMEPILIIEQGEYKSPIAGDSEEAVLTRFKADYYRKGQKYRMLFGGGPAGTVTVKQVSPEGDCSQTGADVVLQTKAGLNSNVMALARKAYQQNGVPASLLSNIQTINLTATDLEMDGKAELIGSYVVRKTKGAEARYLLFLLAEPEGNSYRAGLAEYGKLTKEDVQGGLSLDEIVQSGTLAERLIDQLDLDGDGMAEIITITHEYESVAYKFYQRQQGKWQKVYESGGYTCGF